MGQAFPVPPDDLRGIVQHYLTAPAPRRGYADLLLVALARPEFDGALSEPTRPPEDLTASICRT